MGTLEALLVLFLHFKALNCCIPAPPKPVGSGNQPTTAQPTEVIITTTDEEQPNEKEHETAVTTFAVEHEDSHYNCKFEFSFTVKKGFQTLPGTKSDCKKGNKGSAAVRFLGTHAFELVSKDSIDMTCSMAAVFISNSGGIELVDQAVQESIKCSMKQDNCVTKDGPQFVSKCSVPYIYDGRMYQACTDWPNEKADTKDSMLWCATKTDGNLVMEEGQWGWCSSACGYCGGKAIAKNSTENSVQTTCKTLQGNTCVFPFLEGTQRHEKCASWKSKYKWCATAVNPDLTYKTWEKCDMTTCEPLEDKKARKASLARSVAKCGYDCLINLKKKMVSNTPKPVEKLLAPTPVYSKEQLTNFSYNFVSDTAFQFVSGQNGIFLDCKIGSFSNFPGEKRIHAKCSSDGVFTVTGSLSYKIWESIDNTQFGCMPCPSGYKQILGTLEQDRGNTIGINQGIESFYECVDLCAAEDGCRVFEYSPEHQMCAIYLTLELSSDIDQGHIICQNAETKPTRWFSYPGSYRYEYTFMQQNVGSNSFCFVFNNRLLIPMLFHVQVRENPQEETIKRDNSKWYHTRGIFAEKGLGTQSTKPVTDTNLIGLDTRYTGGVAKPKNNNINIVSFKRGHIVGSFLIRLYFPIPHLDQQMSTVVPTTSNFEVGYGKIETDWYDKIATYMKDKENKIFLTYGIIPSGENMYTIFTNKKGKTLMVDSGVRIPEKILAQLLVRDKEDKIIVWEQYEIYNPVAETELGNAGLAQGLVAPSIMDVIVQEWNKKGMTQLPIPPEFIAMIKQNTEDNKKN